MRPHNTQKKPKIKAFLCGRRLLLKNKSSSPVSRVLSRTVIHLVRMLPYAFSDLPANRSTRHGQMVGLFGLAPDGV